MKKKKPVKRKGTISKKISSGIKRHLKRKVIDISELRNAKIMAENLDDTIVSKEELSKYDPLHAVYIYAQNKMSVFVEQLDSLNEVSKISNAYADAQEEYMPSGPPMSPLTTSYFTCWGFFDLCAGIGKETFGTVTIDICKTFGADEHLIKIFQIMQDSRMGFYIHEGIEDNKVLLRELITQKKIKALSPAGYLGEPGEIWFARIFPEPFPELNFGYSVVFTTPYIVSEFINNSLIKPSEASWLSFFERNLNITGNTDEVAAYEKLMKYGLNKNYWNEYIFESYVNYKFDMINLAGYPDMPLSLPHSKEYEAKYGMGF